MRVRQAGIAGVAILALARAAAAQAPSDGGESERFEVGGYGSVRYDRTDHGSALLLRRLVGEAEARLGRFHFETELEMEGRGDAPASGLTEEASDPEVELELEQAWGSFALTPSLSLRFGALLPPVGRLNNRNEDYLWDVPRRSLIDRTVPVLPGRAAWRSLGIGLAGERALHGTGRLRYEGYLLKDTEDELTVARSGAATSAAAAEVHAGDEFLAGSGIPRAAAFRVALEHGRGSELALSGYAGHFASSDVASGSRHWTLGLDGRQTVGALIVEGEALYARYSGVAPALAGFARAASGQLAPAGGIVQVELGGLAETRSGFWLDVERPYLLPRILGLKAAQVIPVARYEVVRLGGAVNGFRLENGEVSSIARGDRAQDRLTAGVAVRPFAKAVVHATVQRTRALRGRLLDPGIAQDSERGFSLGVAIGF